MKEVDAEGQELNICAIPVCVELHSCSSPASTGAGFSGKLKVKLLVLQEAELSTIR
jgi:hypothetical protein